MRGSKRKMGMALGIIGLIISITVIYFNVSYSKLKHDFKGYLVESEANTNEGKIANKYAIKDLPQCMQKFYSYTGLINKINCNHVNFYFKNADFVNIEMKKTLKIEYSEHIFAYQPARFAFIDTSLFGVPFQGLDSFINGKGGMKGVIAKNITLFNQRGKDMDRSTLVTWLSEIVFMPSEILSGEVEIKEINRNEVYVSITDDNITVSGVYKFSDDGKVIEFVTDDRAMIFSDGKTQYKKWAIIYENYMKNGDFHLPNRLKVQWYLDSGILTYFDGKVADYTFYK